MKIVEFEVLVKGNIKGEEVRKQRRKGEETINTEGKLQNEDVKTVGERGETKEIRKTRK